MDMQKERQDFDKWHYEQYLLENPNIDIANAKYIYDYAHNNALVYQLRESHFTAWQAAKAQAVPKGFVLIKDDTKTVVAIERMVEQQVEASGMDSRRLERLDGWKIIEAALKAQEPDHD